MTDRGQAMLDAIYDEVDQRLNPTGEPCWHCGDEGEIADCFEEFACIDPESGCDDCLRPCPECRINAGIRAKAVREEVIKSGYIDTAIAWIKSIGRWRDGITPEQVQQEIEAAQSAIAAKGEPA